MIIIYFFSQLFLRNSCILILGYLILVCWYCSSKEMYMGMNLLVVSFWYFLQTEFVITIWRLPWYSSTPFLFNFDFISSFLDWHENYNMLYLQLGCKSVAIFDCFLVLKLLFTCTSINEYFIDSRFCVVQMLILVWIILWSL